MISPTTIRAAFVALLQATPAVTALVAAGSISEYKEQWNGDYSSALNRAPSSAIIVRHTATSISRTQQRAQWRHEFELILRTDGDPSELFAAIVNGVPSTGSQTLFQTEVHQKYHPFQEPQYLMQSIIIGEGTSFDFALLRLAFTSKGFE